MSYTSQIRYIRALDSATPTTGKTGLVFGDFTIKYNTQGGTLTPLTTETITTLGTYQAPSDASHIRIKELNSADPTKGVYEVHFHNTQVAAAGVKLWLYLSATGAAISPLEFDLVDTKTVDVTKVGGDSQSATDLKDLVDTGYDPATHKVQGVVLVDATTNLTNAPTNGDLTAAMKTSVTTAASASTPSVTVSDKTGFSLISAYDPAKTAAQAATALSTADWTSARSNYLDNLNVGGNVASHADIDALNQSASRRVVLQAVEQFERPESGSSTHTIELRTYDGDGAAVAGDTTPTLIGTGSSTGSRAASISSATNPSTGVYRWTYTVASTDTIEEILFGVSATISSSVFTMTKLSQVVDEVSATWTSTDATHLTAVYNQLSDGIIDSNLVKVNGETVEPGTATFDVNVIDIDGTAVRSTAGKLWTLDDNGNPIPSTTSTAVTTAHGSGSYQTATGFSTLTAADVWVNGTRTLTAFAFTVSATLTTPPEAVGRPTTLTGMERRTFEWQSNTKRRNRSTGLVELLGEDDETVLETQTQTTQGAIDTQTRDDS